MPTPRFKLKVVVICGPMCYQLDHEGDKDNNDVFVVLLICTLNTIQVDLYNNQQFIVYPVKYYWSCPQSDQECSSCDC